MRVLSMTILLSVMLLTAAALADVPGQISYQGTLTDGGGVAMDTTVSMTFSVWDDSTGGADLWIETQSEVIPVVRQEESALCL